MKILKSNRGFMIVYYMIGGFLVLAGAMWYAHWNWGKSKQSLAKLASNQAGQFAESAINAGRLWLKSPRASVDLPPGGTIKVSGPPMPEGRYELSLYRLTSDSSLVDAYATGYYYVKSSPLTDPVTGKPARRAVIAIRYEMSNAAAYLFALPNDLVIDAGADLGNEGRIYARDLRFEAGNPINLGAAYYYSSCFPSESPANVTFHISTRAVRLESALNLPALESGVRASYQSFSPTGAVPTFVGTVADTPGYPVYFVDGDLHIAQGGDLYVSGVYTIYATGNIYIHRNIIPVNDATDWVGILSEKDIIIASDVPATLTLNGSFFATRSFKSEANHGSDGGNLTIRGSLAVLQVVDIGKVKWPTRSYVYKSCTDPRLKMPNFAEVRNYRVVWGD